MQTRRMLLVGVGESLGGDWDATLHHVVEYIVAHGAVSTWK